ncbi:MAG: proteasome accessory factor PafA2 family protein [Myxococcota bacterium]
MLDRVLGIETEYALIYHPGRADRERPTKLELYRRFEAALRDHVLSLPNAFSPLRAKGGRFLENGGSFHYEATAEDYEEGLLELASPECRDPYTLLCYERCKDELVEALAEDVNRDLAMLGYTGHVRLGKNNRDSQGHSFGSHESYWVEDRLSLPAKLAVTPLWLVLWCISLPVIGIVLGLQLVAVVLVLGLVLTLILSGALLATVKREAARPLFLWLERQAARMESHPGVIAAHAQRLVAPIYPLLWLHSLLYRRFFFRRIRAALSAFLVTRIIYAGSGAVQLDGGPLFRLAQRPPFVRALARIFSSGQERPLFEMRDLFFRPWSVLRSRRRLHLMGGDANLCEWAQVLRVGSTALVLEAIETNRPCGWPVLRDPLASLRELNENTELTLELELADGSRASALEIQRRYLRGVWRTLDDPDSLPLWKRRVLRDWEETLDLLERDPEALADRIDWIAKRRLVYEAAPDPRERAALEARGASLLRAEGALPEAEARLRELVYRLWRIDLRYHELSPRGGYRRLERAGRVRRLSDPARVAEALTSPPPDTRAWARGQAIKWAHAHALSGTVAWHRVRLGKLGWRWLYDPLDPHR